jgi:hypothetical protein
MKHKRAPFTLGFLVVIVFVILVSNRASSSTFLYKNYTLRYDRGWDILCDPYVVKKNDWVYKLFRQRGEIAHDDFPEFLRIFRRINPHIRDINRIRPGQQVLIPLKKLSRKKPLEELTEAVTIPFVTTSKPAETQKLHPAKYKVKNGDSISVLIAKRFGAFGTESYEQGIKLFRLYNPDVEDLDRIYSGQMVLIPDPTIQSRPQDLSFFAGLDSNTPETGAGSWARIHEAEPEFFVSATRGKHPNAPLDIIASALDAKLVNTGTYYLPRAGQEDFAIDLSTLPFLELTNGNRIFFPLDYDNQTAEIRMIQSFWDHANIVRTSPNDPVEKILRAIFGSEGKYVTKKRVSFSDHGVGVEVRGNWIIDTFADEGNTLRHHCITLIDSPRERTSPSIAHYLDQNNIIIKEILKDRVTIPQNVDEPQYKLILEDVIRIDTSDRRVFVDKLTTALGFHYTPNVDISFPYAGIQVQTVSNLLVKSEGLQFLIDFGELYGDSVTAIEKTGFNIIQLTKGDNFPAIIEKLISALGLPYSDSPAFLAASRPARHNTTLRIPGYIITGEGESKVLLSLVPLHDGLINFLADKGIKIVMIRSNEGYDLKPA